MNNIKTNSIDIIYTDPPYSDIINYSELNEFGTLGYL